MARPGCVNSQAASSRRGSSGQRRVIPLSVEEVASSSSMKKCSSISSIDRLCQLVHELKEEDLSNHKQKIEEAKRKRQLDENATDFQASHSTTHETSHITEGKSHS